MSNWKKKVSVKDCSQIATKRINYDRDTLPQDWYSNRGGSLLSGWKGGDAAAVNKGGWRASRGFNRGVGAYFTVGGPISRRQSEPARIHHRVTPRNNLLGDRLSKPSYLFISPRARSVTLIPSYFFSSSSRLCEPSWRKIRRDSIEFWSTILSFSFFLSIFSKIYFIYLA